MAALCEAFEFDISRMNSYTDRSRGIVKHAEIDQIDGRINGLLFAGEVAASSWLADLMLARQLPGERFAIASA